MPRIKKSLANITAVKLKTLLLFLTIGSFCNVLAQAPNISYTTPQVYNVGTAISVLQPVNIGGAVTSNTNYQVTTFAGSGSFTSADGTGTAASFSFPRSIAIDPSGNIFVADVNSSLIRKITPAGIVSTFAGHGVGSFANGVGTAATFHDPSGIATDAAGNVYVADEHDYMIRKITPAALVTTLAGNGFQGLANGTGTAAGFSNPNAVAVDKAGNVYVADRLDYVIRKITPAGVVTTFAGSGAKSSNDGQGTTASFNYPVGLAVDANDNVYVADAGANKIRKITPTGLVSTYAGSGTQGSADGPSATAGFNYPAGLVFDASGNLYVADQNNNKIRKISAAGTVTTIAGSGMTGKTDGGGLLATFNAPSSVTINSQGDLFVGDSFNYVIRKIVIGAGYSIDKLLPAGLVFDPATGIISGTPTTASPPTNYTVTAYNAIGNSSAV